ncbi:hypothetical protein CYLTODRAFT_411899 [Cylindrobasidium torrendii FP15055 ss-10]|uniref:Uncharacterized protein n=1 Tax=Cylindrobasidium torrendii FP15055 ss-10 TaxID=1314674 RepID=A0A0D7B799_9AGAR|nr:hypothetical protein CYLTODRAFT_411899 [Cylindrobasidium torrendii FP15055 ss-10]
MQFLLAILLGIQLAAAAPFSDHSAAPLAPASAPMAARYALPLPAQGAQPQGLTKRQRDSVKAALRRGATGTNTARSNKPSSYPHHGISNTGSQQTGYGAGTHANDNYGQTGYEPTHSNGNYGTTSGSHATENYGTGKTYKKSGQAGSPPPNYTSEFAPYSDTPDDDASSPTVSRRTFHNADFSSAGPQPVPEPADDVLRVGTSRGKGIKLNMFITTALKVGVNIPELSESKNPKTRALAMVCRAELSPCKWKTSPALHTLEAMLCMSKQPGAEPEFRQCASKQQRSCDYGIDLRTMKSGMWFAGAVPRLLPDIKGGIKQARTFLSTGSSNSAPM